VNNLSENPVTAGLSDFHKKTNEHEIPPLLFDHYNADLYDQVRPIKWVDPKAEVSLPSF
jgi:hypothetical protein